VNAFDRTTTILPNLVASLHPGHTPGSAFLRSRAAMRRFNSSAISFTSPQYNFPTRAWRSSTTSTRSSRCRPPTNVSAIRAGSNAHCRAAHAVPRRRARAYGWDGFRVGADRVRESENIGLGVFGRARRHGYSSRNHLQPLRYDTRRRCGHIAGRRLRMRRACDATVGKAFTTLTLEVKYTRGLTPDSGVIRARQPSSHAASA
jgi:hypothetical protein